MHIFRVTNTPIQRIVKTAALLLVLFLFGSLFGGVFDFNPFFEGFTSFYYLFLGIVFTFFVQQSVIDKRVRRLLIGIGILIVLWFFFRLEKYVVFQHQDSIQRHLWYMYYIPMILIPYLSLATSFAVGRPHNQRLPLPLFILLGFVICLVLLVLTNDYHQLIFQFQPQFKNWDRDYSHTLLYWVVIVLTYILMYLSLGVLLKKCMLPYKKHFSLILICYTVFFTILLLLIALEIRPVFNAIRPFEFPETACFMLGGFWLLCISGGLVPNNSSYVGFLKYTGLAVLITNEQNQIVHKSPSATFLSPEECKQDFPLLLDEKIRIYQKQIAGGYAYWEVDETELNAINKELVDARDALYAQYEMIQQENELNTKRMQLEFRSKTYDDIAAQVLPQSKTIEALATEALACPEKFEHNVGLIRVYASYIKRLANLILLSSVNETLSSKELILAILESGRSVQKIGITASAHAEDESTFAPSVLICAYKFFEHYLESNINNLLAISALYSQGVLHLTFEYDSSIPSASRTSVSIVPEEVKCHTEIEDETIFVTIELEEGERA